MLAVNPELEALRKSKKQPQGSNNSSRDETEVSSYCLDFCVL